jgi:ankyrin repeat protein
MQDDQGANVLHIAAELNLSAAITLFLETATGASDSLDSKDRAGVTPLHRCPHS